MWWTLLTFFIVCIWSRSHLVTFYTAAFSGERAKFEFCCGCLFIWKALKMECCQNGAKAGSWGERSKTQPDPLLCKCKWKISINCGNAHYNCSRLRSRRPYASIEEDTVEVGEHIGTQSMFSLVWLFRVTHKCDSTMSSFHCKTLVLSLLWSCASLKLWGQKPH